MRRLGVLCTTLLIPLQVVTLAAVAWRVIGATLRPVEALRLGAEEITGTGRSGQLPVPASHDEIQRLAVTLNGMLDRLEAGRARQREFVGDAAHEMRSPLANMRRQLEVAQRLGERTDWPSVADDLLADTTRAGPARQKPVAAGAVRRGYWGVTRGAGRARSAGAGRAAESEGHCGGGWPSFVDLG